MSDCVTHIRDPNRVLARVTLGYVRLIAAKDAEISALRGDRDNARETVKLLQAEAVRHIKTIKELEQRVARFEEADASLGPTRKITKEEWRKEFK
jgi:uncharacterized protein HemY